MEGPGEMLQGLAKMFGGIKTYKTLLSFASVEIIFMIIQVMKVRGKEIETAHEDELGTQGAVPCYLLNILYAIPL